MSFSSSSKENISLKKLVGKAHTSNNLEFFNESKSSGITVNANAVFGESLPTSPTETVGEATDGIVELLRLTATPLPESIVNGKYHGFKLSLPSDYSTEGNSPERGSGVFINDKDIHTTNGEIQLVPPSFGDVYEAKLFYGGTGEGRTRIPLLDNRNWYLDYFNGVLFQENPPADDNENPEYVEAYIYIGKMASDRFSEGAGGGAGATDLDGLSDVVINSVTNGQFLVYNGDNFVNRVLGTGDLPSLSIADLSDVNALTNIAEGNILAWDASENAFVHQAPSAVYTDEDAISAVGTALEDGAHTTGISINNDVDNDRINVTLDLSKFSIGTLSDVDITNGPTANQVLKWDAVNSKFIPGDETDTQLSDEQVQDIVGTMLTESNDANTHITFAYNDTDGVVNAAVSLASSELEDGNNISLLDANQTLSGNKTFTGSIDLTGAIVTASTADLNDDSTSIATTAFVHDQIDEDIGALNLAATYQPLSSNLTSISSINIANHDILVGDGANSFTKIQSTNEVRSFLASSGSINDLSDVSISTETIDDNHVLKWSGTEWGNSRLSLSNISDTGDLVKTSENATFGAFAYDFTASTLTIKEPGADTHPTTKLYVDTNKQPKDDTLTALSGLATAAGQIIYSTDVDSFAMTSLTENARTFLGTDTSLSNISDVTYTNISDGHVLIYDGNRWNNVALSGAISITNAGVVSLVDNSVTNAKIENSFINLTDGSNTDKLNLGETLTFAGTANEIELSADSDENGENAGATITIGLPDDVTIGQDLTVTRDLVVSGNLTVNGTTTTIDTTNLNVEDTIISLNSGISGQANTNDIGFFLNRGTDDPALIYWDEGEDVFKVGTHSGINNEVTDVGGTEGFSLSGLQVATPGENPNDNSVATTGWVNDNTVTNINDLTDVNTANAAEGKILKFDANNNLVVADDDSGNGFTADTSSLWALDENGDLYPHGIIDGTLDTGMFAINLSAGSLDINSTDVTLHDIIQELSSMNAYTPSTRDAANISDDFFEFDGDGNIVPKAAT